MTAFDWHSHPIAQHTPVTPNYRNTQNVRCFLQEACGPDFKFNRDLMAWITNGQPKTMGDVAAEWRRRRQNGSMMHAK